MMDENVHRLVKAFQSGRLVRPFGEGLSFVDLVRALAHLTGLEGVETSSQVAALCRKIGKADHYLLVLVDGLGMNILRRMPRHNLLRASMAAELKAVFLSTTAAGLSTLATAQWPCAHSVPAWWTRLDRRGITAVTLAHTERSSERPLDEFGISPEELLPWNSFWTKIDYEAMSVLPADIVESPFSIRARGGTARIGYGDLREATEITSRAILCAPGPSITYLYLPQIDTLSHQEGPESKAVLEEALLVEQALAELVASVGGGARILITADHGQAQVSESDRFLLGNDDPILRHLKCTPSGETGVPIFHVLPHCEALFAAEFSARFGERFLFLSPAQVEQMRLLGPGPLSAEMKERMGNFIALAQKPTCLCFGPPEESGCENKGVHGGLSAAEMMIPLMILP